VGVHGMGGIGKSVLAAALARDRKVREAFPDGVIWVGLGSAPDVTALQRRVHRDLGGDGAFETEHQGKEALKKQLLDKAVLLILDDVWRRADVDCFDVLGPRCRALVTTRDNGLLTSLGGPHHLVDLLTEREAQDLLALAAGVPADGLPGEAAEIIAECGRLPLAVVLCGGMIRRGLAWDGVLQQLPSGADRPDRRSARRGTAPPKRLARHSRERRVPARRRAAAVSGTGGLSAGRGDPGSRRRHALGTHRPAGRVGNAGASRQAGGAVARSTRRAHVPTRPATPSVGLAPRSGLRLPPERGQRRQGIARPIARGIPSEEQERLAEWPEGRLLLHAPAPALDRGRASGRNWPTCSTNCAGWRRRVKRG